MAGRVFGPPTFTSTARVLLTMEEKGVEYELFPIDVFKGEHKQPPHTTRNPFGQVPAFQDGDLTLFESRAISKYIARKHKGTGPDLLGYSSEKDGAMVEVWMEVEGQQYNPAIAAIVFELIIHPIYGGKADESIVAAEVVKLGKVLDVYEARLSKSKYLAGDFCSLADLHHVPYTFLLMATTHAMLINSRPHVKALWGSLMARPSCKKVTDVMAVAGGTTK